MDEGVIDRETWKSKHQADAYKNKSLTLLKQSAYYRNVYIKRDSGLCQGAYGLDGILTEYRTGKAEVRYY